MAKDHAKGGLEHIILMDEINWRQKSKVQWLREGDNNTRYFHRIANSNCCNNTICHLSTVGEISTDQFEIMKGVTCFYQHLFADEAIRLPFLDGLDFAIIDEEDRRMLDSPFTEEEVFGVVKSMNGDKAPSPDGFSLAFFQVCWGIVKDDIMKVFHSFHCYRSFEKSLNATFLALIPKKSRAIEMKDFCPINLVSRVYKIIAKVLSNKLTGYLGS